MPSPSVPGAMDFPSERKLALKLPERLKVKEFDASQGFRPESVLAFERDLALDSHSFAVLPSFIDGRVEDDHTTFRTQAAARFGECSRVVGRIMNRRIEHRQIELRGRERKVVEATFNHGEMRGIVTCGAQSVARICKNVHCHGRGAQFGKAVGKPAVSGTEV